LLRVWRHDRPALNSNLFVNLRSGPPIPASALGRRGPFACPSPDHAAAIKHELIAGIG